MNFSEQDFLELKALIAKKLKVELKDLKDDTDFVADLAKDSLDLIDILFEIESKYPIQISNADATELTTMAKIKNFIINN
jgi:acyl carrier protein